MLLSLGPSLAVDLVAVGLLAWVTWQTAKDRSPPNAVPFALMSGSLLLWALLSLISEFPNAWGVGSNLAAIAQVVPVVFLPAIWLVYVLGYIGRETGFTSLRGGLFVLLALPLIGAAATFEGDPTREEIRRSLASLVGTELLLLFIIYAYAAFLFLRYGWNHGRVSRTQVGIQLGAISAPYIIGGWLDGSLIIDGVTGGLLVSGVLLTVAIQRYPVLTGFPKADYVARSRVVESLQEAVVVVDWEANILDANVTAEGLFGWATRDVIGTPVSAAVDGFDVTNLSAGTTEVVSLQTTKGRRQFQYTVSDVERDTSDSDGEPVARTIVFRDVTDQRTREQRLSVLNRVLRHNARNKLDVILAHADHVEDDTHRTAIQNSASELASVSRKAREAEAVMTDSVGAPSTVDIAAVAHEVAATARDDYPDSSISVTAPERLQLTSYRTVVRRLMTELVENAIVHSDDPARVDIEVETTADDIPQLRIADNGPGIPDRERDLLTESSETQLEHGLGVGLWFVNWAVSQLGAELEFQSTGTTGTTVVVRFYRNRESMPQDSDGSHNR
ncbi:ATP-binding protein [Halorubrum ezzemoulense]|uniref:ATP-binding protein n=1 Tax=Halorubrum ezzemoulense TaxID=337243 RepID=UPI00232BC79F|nr:ATP-binding protein [Halorubrum ezzemoulense]MDB9253996.1 histidine kinase N-terminal 7TM domain-containing protein [Halorubrum ezzemoulense]MDB9257472.1 histidine kinase N-terminal 7TM domain-containing protein [Halorubrum ezzemoulense]MDB9278119.1 histidine kinase N-terminal 7TM domain-containing protein [Halorubrum ezzemoulense]